MIVLVRGSHVFEMAVDDHFLSIICLPCYYLRRIFRILLRGSSEGFSSVVMQPRCSHISARPFSYFYFSQLKIFFLDVFLPHKFKKHEVNRCVNAGRSSVVLFFFLLRALVYFFVSFSLPYFLEVSMGVMNASFSEPPFHCKYFIPSSAFECKQFI